MDRIELYVDREERLTLDLFDATRKYDYLTRKKGKNCYGNIAEICSKPVSYVKFRKDKQDFTIFFDDCYIHVNEAERVLGRRGTAPVFRVVNKYLEQQKRKEVELKNAEHSEELSKPLKVSRKNKHVGKKILATALTFTMLSSVFAYRLNQTDKLYSLKNESSSTTQLYDEEHINPTIMSVDSEEITTPAINITEQQQAAPSLEICIEYEDRSDTEKAQITRAYYGETIEKYAKMYGVDPKIIIGIATQERGIHSDRTDLGGATGLMQIQNEVWIGQKLTAYNVETNQYETVVITREDLSDVFKNIRYGCMIYQNCLGYMEGNVFAAIQCYNMGCGNMFKILNSYSLETGKSKSEILGDITDNNWLSHRNIINVGDRKYLENVLSWIGPEIQINIADESGNLKPITIINETKTKSMS